MPVWEHTLDKSDVQETLVSLYLRLNGYFVSGFIAHADYGVRTEMDVLAVRFPLHSEPEREVLPCDRLAVPNDEIDFIVGEVKGGTENVRFNWASGINPSPSAPSFGVLELLPTMRLNV